MQKHPKKPRSQKMEKLARENPYYAYELAKKNLDSRSNREAEVRCIAKKMRI